MTRIVLFLSAVPLAALLALVLNALLERATDRREVLKSLVFFVSGATLLVLGAAAPVAAGTESDRDLCTEIECSLTVDRQDLDELWSNHKPRKVKLLYQSRIPVTEQMLLDSGGSRVVDDRGQRRPPKGSTLASVDPSPEAPRR